MSVYFVFHVADMPRYSNALDSLGRVLDDVAIRARFIPQVRSALVAARRLPWNEEKSSMFAYFDKVVDAFEAMPNAESLQQFGRTAVCALALPLFQMFPVHKDAREEAVRGSPNFAPLAEDDAGFYEFFSLDPRVPPIMASEHAPEPYPLGESTVLLTRAEVRDLRDAAIAAQVPRASPAVDASRERARARVISVMDAALTNDGYGVLYSVYE